MSTSGIRTISLLVDAEVMNDTRYNYSREWLIVVNPQSFPRNSAVVALIEVYWP